MNNSKSPVLNDDKSPSEHHFIESNQSAFRRISSIKSSDQTDKMNEKSIKNGTSVSSNDIHSDKTSIPNPFLSPLITSSADFHSHLALLRPFLSQTLPFVPPIPTPTFWHTFPFLHPYLSNLRPPGLVPPIIPSTQPSPLQSKASTNTNNKKSSATSSSSPPSATHYHQYTITNNNVLMPSSSTLIDFIRRPAPSNGSVTNSHSTTNNTKSKNLKKYKCDICSRAFSRSNTLVTHKRIHTGEKPFVCDICDRAFRQPGNLTRHKLTHTAAKPYACGVCSKAFNRASNLHAHQRTHSLMMPISTKTAATNNNGHDRYTCNHCHQIFNHKFELNLHVAALHNTDIKLFPDNNNNNNNSNNNSHNHDDDDVQVDEEDNENEDDDMEEQSYEKDEEMSEDSEQNIDLLED